MYTNGSEEFNRIVETPNNKAIQKRLVFEDTGVIIDKFKTLIMYSSSNNQELQIGTTNMSYLDVEAFTDIAIFDGQKLRLECGVELSDGSMEYAPMGIFTAINVEKGLNSVKFTANDNMQKTEKLYTSSLTYPATSDKIISEICEICEIELTTPIENPITVAEKLQGYTCREVLGFIAGIHGKFACFDRLGQLNLRWYSEMPIEKQNSLIWSFTKSQEPFIVDKIEIAKNTETKFTSGEGNNIIYHSNPLATQQITDDILDDLRGFSYSTSKIEMLDDIRLDIWDVIKVTYLDGNEYFIPCMSIKQNMGASSTYIESFSKGKTQNQYRYEGVTTQFLNRMATELLITNRVVASKVDADYVQSHAITTDNLEAIKADIKYAVIEDLDADFITTEELEAESAVIKVAVVQELSAEFGDIKQLKSDVAKIDTLIFGTASGDVIQTTFANSVIAQLGDAQIKSAMIQDVSASKITAGTIYTNDVTIQSKNGQMMLKDNTIQISDGTRARVQIGKDASNDYSINVWDKSGNLMFSQGGITDKAIKSAIIRNDMVSENANIHAGKLDINSLFTEINGSSNTIKANKIYLDEEEQTLEASFKSMTTIITDINGQIIVDNLIPYPYNYSFPRTNRGITFDDYDGKGGIIANGTGDGTGQPYFICNGRTFVLKANQAYTFASNCTDERGFAIAYFRIADGSNTVAKITYTDIRNGVKTTVTSDYCAEVKNGVVYDGVTIIPTEDIRIQFEVRFDTKVGTVENAIFHPMLVEGNVVRPWQPYALSRNGLKETITSQGTQLEVLNGQISSKIWKQDITTAIDNVDIGGRNLILNSASIDFNVTTTNDTTNKNVSLGKFSDYFFEKRKVGTQLTLSFDWETTGTQGTFFPQFNNTPWGGFDGSRVSVSSTNNRGRYEYTITLAETAVADTAKYTGLFIRIDKLDGTTKITNIKCEFGNKATDWTPAPEDVDADITTLSTKYSTLEQDVGGFKTTVSETYAPKSALSSANTAINNLTTKYTTLEQNVNSFKTTVSNTYTTKTEFDNLTIGGRNLFLKTSIERVVTTTGGSNEAGEIYYYSDYGKNALHNGSVEKITISFDWETTATSGKISIQCGWNVWTSIGLIECSPTNQSGHKVVTIDVPATWLNCTNVGMRPHFNGVTGTTTIKNLKLEIGNKSTDWTPAPEDVDAEITTVQTIAQQTADKFNWLVKSGTSSTNFTLTDRMAELTASIISLNGNVKVNGGMIVDGAITAGKIATNAITSEKIVAGAITADKIDVDDLFAQNITVKGTFKATGSAWIPPAKEDIDLLRKAINGEITLTSAQKTAFDFDTNSKVDVVDFAICKNIVLKGSDAILNSYPNYKKTNSNIQVLINPSNPNKVLSITAQNSFGRNIDVTFGLDGMNIPKVNTTLVDTYDILLQGKQLSELINGIEYSSGSIMATGDVIAGYGTTEQSSVLRLAKGIVKGGAGEDYLLRVTEMNLNFSSGVATANMTPYLTGTSFKSFVLAQLRQAQATVVTAARIEGKTLYVQATGLSGTPYTGGAWVNILFLMNI